MAALPNIKIMTYNISWESLKPVIKGKTFQFGSISIWKTLKPFNFKSLLYVETFLTIVQK